MSIIEIIKSNRSWYLEKIFQIIIIGILIIVVLSYVWSFSESMEDLFIFVVIFSIIVYAVIQTFQAGFMGLFILIACVVYNPNMDKFNLFKEKELSMNYNTVEVNHQYDWLLFTLYNVKFTKEGKTLSGENRIYIKERIYIGILKNFFLLPRDRLNNPYTSTPLLN
jgi:hypothetical protein